MFKLLNTITCCILVFLGFVGCDKEDSEVNESARRGSECERGRNREVRKKLRAKKKSRGEEMSASRGRNRG